MDHHGTNESAASCGWQGDLFLGPMVSVFAGRGQDTAAHLHPAHKVVIGPSVRLQTTATGGQARVVAAGTSHRVYSSGGAPMLIAYLDARRYTLPQAHALAERWQALEGVPQAACDMLEDALRTPPPRLDRRVTRILRELSEGATVAEALRSSGLSDSRATHLVRDTLGAPPRSIRGWLRLREAVDEVMAGCSVTHAAHATGFADASHFYRACRGTLGIAPSALLAGAVTLHRVGPACGGFAKG